MHREMRAMPKTQVFACALFIVVPFLLIALAIAFAMKFGKQLQLGIYPPWKDYVSLHCLAWVTYVNSLIVFYSCKNPTVHPILEVEEDHRTPPVCVKQ